MVAPYTLKWDQTFENLFFKQLIKCPRILSTSKQGSIGDFPSKTSTAKTIAKRPQLHLSVCFWTDKAQTMNSFTQFLHRTHFLFTRLRDVFKLSQIWIFPSLQKVSSQCPDRYRVVGYDHFSPHDKVHHDVFKSNFLQINFWVASIMRPFNQAVGDRKISSSSKWRWQRSFFNQ